MQEFNGSLTSPGVLAELFANYSVVPLKKLGQNFLVDANILAGIAKAAGLNKDSCCVEIGPGAGALTAELARRAGKVLAVEVDRGLIPLLHFTLQAFDNVHIVHGDILKQDLRQLTREHFGDAAFAVAANLPYNITTPAIMMLLESGLPITHMVLLMQREVGERLLARPGTKEYGALSIAVQYACEVQSLFTVSPNCFMPRPKVESVLIRLTRRECPAVDVSDRQAFFEIVRALFAMRRKTLLNNLLAYYPNEEKGVIQSAIEKSGIQSNARAETLSLEELARLFAALPAKGRHSKGKINIYEKP
ncbi:MAG: 16S rRNA (adenine(1518)-N(6)/adenine(1519)-N(6))-dimethyltransferase RsmA [Bacillota bacterium]